EQEIEAGGFFILNGVMVYVAEVRDPHIRNGKRNARLRLIFDNGTEGQNLLRYLATQLYKHPNGRRISDPNAGPLFGAE
ncbi:GIY-YIG nuclease family protein, partial [Acinetobacter baumannii]